MNIQEAKEILEKAAEQIDANFVFVGSLVFFDKKQNTEDEGAIGNILSSKVIYRSRSENHIETDSAEYYTAATHLSDSIENVILGK